MKISKKLIEKKDLFIAVEEIGQIAINSIGIKIIRTQGICDRRSSFFQQVADLDVGQLGNRFGRMASGHNEGI
jgi:hypothetical protein